MKEKEANNSDDIFEEMKYYEKTYPKDLLLVKKKIDEEGINSTYRDAIKEIEAEEFPDRLKFGRFSWLFCFITSRQPHILLEMYNVTIEKNPNEIGKNAIEKQFEILKLMHRLHDMKPVDFRNLSRKKQIDNILLDAKLKSTKILELNVEGLLDNMKSSKINERALLVDLICHKKKAEIAERIKDKYNGIKGKRLRKLLMALQETSLIDKNTTDRAFHNACSNSFTWDIKGYSAMEKRTFIVGSKPTDGVYRQSEDEKELAKMISNLKKLLNELTTKKSN